MAVPSVIKVPVVSILVSLAGIGDIGRLARVDGASLLTAVALSICCCMSFLILLTEVGEGEAPNATSRSESFVGVLGVLGGEPPMGVGLRWSGDCGLSIVVNRSQYVGMWNQKKRIANDHG